PVLPGAHYAEQPILERIASHRVTRVDHEIQDHLLKLHPVAHDTGARLLQLQVDCNMVRYQVVVFEEQDLVDTLVDIQGAHLDGSMEKQCAQATNDFSCPLVLIDNLLEGVGHFCNVRGIPLQVTKRGLCVEQYGSQRLIQLVRDRSR